MVSCLECKGHASNNLDLLLVWGQGKKRIPDEAKVEIRLDATSGPDAHSPITVLEEHSKKGPKTRRYGSEQYRRYCLISTGFNSQFSYASSRLALAVHSNEQSPHRKQLHARLLKRERRDPLSRKSDDASIHGSARNPRDSAILIKLLVPP
jgi:hypothetical protein